MCILTDRLTHSVMTLCLFFMHDCVISRILNDYWSHLYLKCMPKDFEVDHTFRGQCCDDLQTIILFSIFVLLVSYNI